VQAVNPNDAPKRGQRARQARRSICSMRALMPTMTGNRMVRSRLRAPIHSPTPRCSRSSNVQRPGASQIALTWSSVAGKQYEVLAATSADGTYSVISGAQPIPSAGANTSFRTASRAHREVLQGRA
jgi:hypothetical protein